MEVMMPTNALAFSEALIILIDKHCVKHRDGQKVDWQQDY